MSPRVFLAAAVLAAAAAATTFAAAGRAAPTLTVTALDVGQGDAVLVAFPSGSRWLIDGGPDDSVVPALDRLVPFADRRLTGVILTHPHADHVAGLVAVLRRYEVGQVLLPDASHTTPEYRTFLETVRRAGVPATPVDHPFVWEGTDGGVPWRWEFLYPERSFPEPVPDLNAVSVVSRLAFGRTRFLLMGDAPAEVEALLLAEGRDLAAEVLKVGHHGSAGSTDAAFLAAVRPDAAVISVGAGNRFGHPAPATTRRLAEAGALVYRTDQHGAVGFRTTGDGTVLAAIDR